MCSGTPAAGKRPLLLFFLVAFAASLQAQEVYVSIRNQALYAFVEEMANEQRILVNSAVKPYSRRRIARWLEELHRDRASLNARQQADLDFYRKDFRKELEPGRFDGKRLDLFYYRDSLFTLSVNPILGYSYFHNDSGGFYRRTVGAEAFAYAGKHFGFSAALRDNHEDVRVTSPEYLQPMQGQVYKVDGVSPGGDFSEMTGGVTYAWPWGSLGLVKDRFTWGDQQFGAHIFSDRAPSYARLTLDMHPVSWFDFHYFHGWLVSGVIDSSNSYWTGTGTRLTFRPKYVAANLFTFTAWQRLRISIGNSIVYGDVPVQPAYLIPVFFYKSVDHSQSGAGSNYLGQNSQMFLNVSSRQIRHLHLYASLFIDEISFSNMSDPEEQTNFVSLKTGATLSGYPLRNVSLSAEYTITRPGVYRHYIPTVTYASNAYTLGHYLGDNAEELALGLSVEPRSRLTADLRWVLARKGETYPYTGQAGTPGDGQGLPFMESVAWQSSSVSLRLNYQALNDGFVFAGIAYSDQHGDEADRYSMPNFIGTQVTLNAGVAVGF